MGFSLRNFLEEAVTQVNPFDKGQTAQTVRNNRQAVAAQTRKIQDTYNSPQWQQLQQKANARNVANLNSGAINRDQYNTQMQSILGNGQPMEQYKLTGFDRANKAVADAASRNFVSRNLLTGLSQLSPTNVAGNVAGYAGRAGQAFGWDNGKYLAEAGDTVARMGEADPQGDFRSRGFGDTLVRGGIGLAGDMVNSLNPVTLAATTGKYFTSSANDLARQMEATGKYSPLQSFGAGTALGGVNAALERTGLNKITGGAGNKMINSGAKAITTRLVKSGFTEGITEGAQQFVQNLAQNRLIDRNQGLMDGVAQSAAAGAILGAAGRGAVEVTSPRGHTPEMLQERNKWVTIYNEAEAKGKTGAMEIASRNIDRIDRQAMSIAGAVTTKLIKPVYADSTQRYGESTPQVGKTDISNAENFVKGRSLQEFNNFLTVNNGSAKKSQIIQEIKSQYGSTENFWRVMNGKEQTKSFARGELGLNSQPTLKKPVAQVGKTPRDVKTERAPKYGVKHPELEGKLSPEDALIQAGIDSGHNTLAGVGKGAQAYAELSDLSKSQREYVQKSATSYFLSGDPVFQERVRAYTRGNNQSTPVAQVGKTDKIKSPLNPKQQARMLELADNANRKTNPNYLEDYRAERAKLEAADKKWLKQKDMTAEESARLDAESTPVAQVGKTEAPTVPDKYLKEYANMLRSFDDEASGGQMIPTADGGYKRISEHSPFYRDYFAEKGRKPSGKDYLEYAKNNIENDKDFMDYVAQKIEEDKLPKPISNRPSGKMSVAEKESLFSQVPQGTDKQIKISKPSGTKNIKVNKLVANEDLPLYETKKVSTADKVFRSTRSIIERQGESGKQLAGLLQKSRDTEELFQADVLNRLKTVRSLKGKEYENFVDATQGLAKPESAKVQQAIKEWKAVHPEMRQRAVDAGLDVGDLGETYYPHFVDYEKVFKDKNTYNQALNHLVKTGQAKNVEDAIQLLGYARDVSRNRKFGNLEASRLVDIPFYDKTKNSLVSYIQGTSKRIAQTETFGAKDEVALKYIADAGKQGYDTEAMKNAYDVAVGAKQYNPNTKAFSNKMRQYNSTTRLGQGALTNMTQNANTGIVTGHLRTMGAMLKQLDPKTRKFVESTGTISDGVINDLREGAGFTGKVLSKITAPGFSQVEKFNRSVAATAGRDYAQSLARKGDVATLQKLGVTGKIGKELTEAQQIQAARKIVEKTQFKVDPQDLPGWVDSPGGKLVAQFRTFSYSQSKFFSNEILKPASKGNLMPLARLLAVIPAGYAMAEVKRVLNNRPEEDNKARKGIEAFGNVGGAGLAVDMFRSMVPLNNKYLPADRRVSMAVGTFGGPTAGAAAELVGAVSEVAQRKNVPEKGLESNKVAIANNGESYSDATQLARLGLRQIPIVGTRLQNTLVPYKSNETKLSEQVKKEKDSATGLTKLSDGKYVAVINGEKKTFDNEQKAKKAISINDFMNSNDKTKEIDGKVYYKNDNTESGYSVKNKAEWDYDKSVNGLDLAIDKAKASNDLKGWMDAADKKYQALIKKRDSYDPETEFDKIDTVNKQLLNLEQEASKYSSNGYIKKPKTTSKKDSKSGNFNYKFFGFGSDPISTTKSLRQLLKEATLS